jgi:hypothetical protein
MSQRVVAHQGITSIFNMPFIFRKVEGSMNVTEIETLKRFKYLGDTVYSCNLSTNRPKQEDGGVSLGSIARPFLKKQMAARHGGSHL